MTAMNLAMDLTEQGLLPDPLVRSGIRRLLRQRLDDIASQNCERNAGALAAFAATMAAAEVAPLPHKANEQHYEVPAEFFARVLGPYRKYSCCQWDSGCNSLGKAEATALATTCARVGLANGMDILELGCGWGSLSLWMAARYPDSHIVAVSNSASQRKSIEQRARQNGLDNLQIITGDMNGFDVPRRFDRVVSVEMFEHMRNYPVLFRRIHEWLKPGGRFFMHIFCHRDVPYAFDPVDESDWMSRHFFSGGMMPADDLPLMFQDDLRFLQRWRWDGRHYEKTANAWLANMDRQRQSLWPLMEQTYGDDAQMWWQRWRMFFMACAELFGYDDGQQWWVSHYLFERRDRD